MTFPELNSNWLDLFLLVKTNKCLIKMHVSHTEISVFLNSSNSIGSKPSTPTDIKFFFLILIMEHQELFHSESTYILLLILENYVSFNQLMTKISLSLHEILALIPPKELRLTFMYYHGTFLSSFHKQNKAQWKIQCITKDLFSSLSDPTPVKIAVKQYFNYSYRGVLGYLKARV